jgi:hypothetical protein
VVVEVPEMLLVILLLDLLGQTVAQVVGVDHLAVLLLVDQAHPGKVMMEELVLATAVEAGAVKVLLGLMAPLMLAGLAVLD